MVATGGFPYAACGRRLNRCVFRTVVLMAAGVLVMVAGPAHAQNLRYSNHRELEIPEYAMFRLGPFYSDMTLSQTAGYRYSRGTGAGTDFLSNNRRGVIREDGEEFPLITDIGLRNYLLISRRADLDFSMNLRYEHYPRETQEDAFSIDLADEGVSADLSLMTAVTPFVKVTAGDRFLYRTDYVDTRGMEDRYGGQEYEFFENTFGVDTDWMLMEDHNLGISASRKDHLPQLDGFDEQELVAYVESLVYEVRLSPFLVLGASAGFAQNQYPATNRPDSASQQYGMHADARLTEYSTARAHVGYSLASTDGGGDIPGTLVGGISLATRLAENLNHGLSFNRERRPGFRVAFETRDSVQYNLSWTDVDTAASLFAGYSVFDPDDPLSTGYADWSAGIRTVFPLWFRMLNLELSSDYSRRDNDAATLDPAAGIDDLEQQADYDTWVSRAATRLKLTQRSDLTFSYEHIERTSDADQLAYTRDVVAALWRYTYKF
ncbi:MAG: hypothetical protein A2340_02110 [Lentisphaerae bacterium RIFOXYB12_FULL_60_10]|nr:MAG: hypothetical protein A2340_02110 [Lentisphaerae bacterium RIFOXYB12_FULL_60_10]